MHGDAVCVDPFIRLICTDFKVTLYWEDTESCRMKLILVPIISA
jgi:hypothetical protein